MKQELDLFTLNHRIFLVQQFYQEFGNYNSIRSNYEDHYGNNPAISRDVLHEIIEIFKETGSVKNDQQRQCSEFRKDREPTKRNLRSPASAPFECEGCNQRFYYFNNLKRHVLESHELLGVYKCEICHVDFRKKHKLVAHMKSHDDKWPSQFANNYKQCIECGKLCPISTYNLHIISHKADSTQTCNICGKTFKWNCGYVLHIMKHNGMIEKRNEVTCKICGITLAGERTLKIHLQKSHAIASENKPIVINIPNQQDLRDIKIELTDNLMDLEDYMDVSQDFDIHTESIEVQPLDRLDRLSDESDEDYWPMDDFPSEPIAQTDDKKGICAIDDQLCDLCGKVLKGGSSLKYHMETHIENVQHKCPHEGCNRIYKSIGTLQWHLRTHNTNYMYKCTLCPKFYIFNYLLKNHILSQHSEKMFPCKFCRRIFTEKTDLGHHLTKVHKLPNDAITEEDTQEVCKQIKQERDAIMARYKCIVCGKGFRQHNIMKKHMRSHEKSEEALMCPEPGCGRSFPIQKYLDLHMVRHTDKRYKCAHCENIYKDRTQMKIHIKKIHLKEDPMYKCHLCPYQNWNNNSFKRHMLKYHNIDDPFPNSRASKSSRRTPKDFRRGY